MSKLIPNYDKFPVIHIKEQGVCVSGWDDITAKVRQAINSIPAKKKIVILECYTGIDDEEVITALKKNLPGKFYFSKDYMLDETAVKAMIYPDVTDDEIFGYITRLKLQQFFNPAKMQKLNSEIAQSQEQIIYLYGVGASLLCTQHDLLVYFDMPRWEHQLRFRRNEVSNLGVDNKNDKASLQYKQAFFVDWRVCDKHKKTLMNAWDFIIDTTQKNDPKMVDGKALNKAFQQAVAQPIRFVPFFDPGPWGGQWMKEYCGLDRNEKNFAWCFDCVPEENSLLLKFDDLIFETPGINLVFAQAVPLLGDAVQARFGDEFPIRFDFLDTMDGGNLSLQVHPTNQYVREHFGMDYTQDESYYMLDTADDACVYLGLKNNISPVAMIEALNKANTGAVAFDAEKFVEKWPVKKHDHVLIPAGTVHCSGKNSMVLEISATPYIFTFKLWDWGRMGLDGKPRPINIEHGKQVIDWTLTPERTKKELLNTVTPVCSGEGWREEKTGLHEREFIETRRHWFTKTVHHTTGSGVNVLNLVEGREVRVESPSAAFEPFIVHYAETFVIPANISEYTITPYGESAGKECATLKAFVRTNA